MIKILIADDHRLVREGLRQILDETEDIQVLDEAADGHEVLRCVTRAEYDVILLDISMPGLSGLDVLKQVRVMKPECRVLILSMHPEEQYAVRLLQAGASGYLTKNNASDELISAIRKVARGGKYVSDTLAERLAVLLQRGSERPPHELLSDREYQVFMQIASGKSVSEIAGDPKLSPKTVGTYRARVLVKMNMKSNLELMHYAISNKLVE